MDDNRKKGLLGSWSLVAGLTTVSRVLGLAREIAFAWFIGAGVVMDAFIVAFRIPSLFRHFFAEGALSQSFVPVYSERMEAGDDKEELGDLLGRVMGTLGAVVALVSLVGVIFAPIFVWLCAPGFAVQGGESYEQAVTMLRRTFPYLFFISITAMLAAVLNAHRKFAAAAFTPVMMNVCLIAAASLYAMQSEAQGAVLGWGVFVAGLAQMVFLLFFARSTCGPFRPQWGWRDSNVRRILTLMVPVIIGSSAAQVGVVLDTILASFLVSGSISWLNFSQRLMEFPLGVFGVALATVALPKLSRLHAAGERAEYLASTGWAIRSGLAISLPCAAGLFILAEPIMATLFLGGKFNLQDVEMAAVSLQAYAVGLPGLIGIKTLVPSFFARQDMKTPVKVAVAALACKFAVTLPLLWFWVAQELHAPHAVLAGGTALGATINAAVLWLLFRGQDPEGTRGAMFKPLLRIVVAVGLLSMLLIEFAPASALWPEVSRMVRVLWILACVGGAAAAYFLCLFLTGHRWRDTSYL
ncbi:MAG: murein biosynthesis integral membrane protein MurJ [Gammaproteobacteria bacterium]|nr:murein biosynthesis integral membrane protein MurJ [Gammaproteobacteria bacterium]